MYIPRYLFARIMADLEALDEFNGTIKRLVRFATSKSTKLTIGGAVKRVKLLLDDAPLAAIQTVGPLLVKYREQVMSSDEKYFMTTDLSKDIPAEHAADAKDIIALINDLKGIYEKCSQEDKKTVLNDMKQLLVSYETYVARSR
jgi:hypothetical protein